MDNKEIRSLKILEEIDSNQKLTQRDLSKKLDISLGLANSFVKRLANKGYLKITTIPKNRIKYILTPKGAAEKTRLTYQYIQFSFEFYRKTRKNLRELFKRLNAQGVKRIVFYGVSEFAEIAYLSLKETPIEVVALVDDEREGEHLIGFKVENSAILNSISYDKILITSINLQDEAIENILNVGIPREKIIEME
jgi:DNA-binding MarR family transcriptional regulator